MTFYQEQLILLQRQFSSVRPKRTTTGGGAVCSGLDPSQPCCLDQVTVDFKDVGLDFILSPRQLQFSFCKGSCHPHLVRPNLFTRAASQILYVSNSANNCLDFRISGMIGRKNCNL